MVKKKELPKGLVDKQIIKPKRNPNDRHDAGKQFLTNLIYMVPLHKVLSMIIPFYWDADKDILDTTAGKKISWETFPYNHHGFNGKIPWRVEFNDLSPDADADYHLPAQKVDEIGKHYDIIFNDFPFTDLKNGLESFGTKKKVDRIRKEKSLGRRHEYFRKFRPLGEVFPECVDAWNKTADSLLIKIGDSHKDYHLLTNHVDAVNTFDHARNPKSDFHLLDIIHYRGVYSSRGGRFPFAQSVTSYYLIFKKDLKKR